MKISKSIINNDKNKNFNFFKTRRFKVSMNPAIPHSTLDLKPPTRSLAYKSPNHPSLTILLKMANKPLPDK